MLAWPGGLQEPPGRLRRLKVKFGFASTGSTGRECARGKIATGKSLSIGTATARDEDVEAGGMWAVRGLTIRLILLLLFRLKVEVDL